MDFEGLGFATKGIVYGKDRVIEKAKGKSKLQEFWKCIIPR